MREPIKNGLRIAIRIFAIIILILPLVFLGFGFFLLFVLFEEQWGGGSLAGWLGFVGMFIDGYLIFLIVREQYRLANQIRSMRRTA